jgi:hypothetical protein
MFIVDGSTHSLVYRHDYAFIEALLISALGAEGDRSPTTTDSPNPHAGRLQFFRYHAIG